MDLVNALFDKIGVSAPDTKTLSLAGTLLCIA